MLPSILILFFVTQVFTQVTSTNIPIVRNTSECLKFQDFKSDKFEGVKGVWTFAPNADQDKCSDIHVTVSDATPDDIKKIQDHCKDTEAKYGWDEHAKAEFNWTQSIKKLTFTKAMNDTLISKMTPDEYIILLECAKIERIQYKRNGNVSIWTLSEFTPKAVQLPEGQKEVCITENPGHAVYTGIVYSTEDFYNCNSASSFSTYLCQLTWILGILNIVYTRYTPSAI